LWTIRCISILFGGKLAENRKQFLDNPFDILYHDQDAGNILPLSHPTIFPVELIKLFIQVVEVIDGKRKSISAKYNVAFNLGFSSNSIGGIGFIVFLKT